MTESDAARRARQKINSANYRARQKAVSGTKVARGTTPHGGGALAKAQADARATRTERDRVLRTLPNVMSIDAKHPAKTAARIIPALETERGGMKVVKSKKAQQKRAAAIRQNLDANRLMGIGRQRKNALKIELTDGAISEQLQEMNPRDRGRFESLTSRISAGSIQSIGILFKHAGGQALYSAAIEKILYPPSREAGFAILESLADYAESAAEQYSPRALREQGLGDKNGRLNI